MKKLRLRREVKDLIGALIFYGILILGVIILNARFKQIEDCMNDGNSREYCVEVGR